MLDWVTDKIHDFEARLAKLEAAQPPADPPEQPAEPAPAEPPTEAPPDEPEAA